MDKLICKLHIKMCCALRLRCANCFMLPLWMPHMALLIETPFADENLRPDRVRRGDPPAIYPSGGRGAGTDSASHHATRTKFRGISGFTAAQPANQTAKTNADG